MNYKKRILFISDNEYLIEKVKKIIIEKQLNIKHKVNYKFSFFNKSLKEKYKNKNWIQPINIKKELEVLINSYDIIFSLHSKQLFPNKLVNSVKCINIHPGYNPYNRGWFPQVFSIINGLPAGVTIHEIDEKLDHGAVIFQKKIKINSYDTSLSAYNKIINAELELLNEHMSTLMNLNYTTKVVEEGNLNLKMDFENLCEINLNNIDSFKNHINKLRALTHGDYLNAYFIDNNGDKIFIKIKLQKVE